MLAFPDAAATVRCCLALIDRAGETGLPPLHAGTDAGAVVHRDGDYHGSVVNGAARVADRAGARQALVTGEVVIACRDERDLRFDEMESALLKNVARPVTLHRASRAGD